jgi:hypothetical protein
LYPHGKLRGWAAIIENLDKSINYRLNTAFQKRHGFAQSLSSALFAFVLFIILSIFIF